MTIRPLAALLAFLCISAHADWRPDGAFASAGFAGHGTESVTAGLQWAWDWRGTLGYAEATAITEAYVSEWRSRSTRGTEHFTQVGLVPIARLRPSGGASPWFFEIGVGGSMMNDLYRSRDKQFSTRFNFMDVIGIGHSFGARREQELGLRITHNSNAGIKEPNPGETFLQLRYATRF